MSACVLPLCPGFGGLCILGYVMGIGFGVSAPIDRRMGGMTRSEIGPQAPMTTDQKNDGRSRAAQRQ